MSIKVKAAIKRSEQVPAQGEAVYQLLKPVEASQHFFPRVHRIENMGDDCYHWWLEPMGTHKYQHRVEYVSQWEFDDQQRTIRWRPLEQNGNARIAGVWSIEPVSTAKATRLALEIKAELKLDLPRWMQLVAEPIVQTEFQKLLNTYFDNVVQHCRTLT
jgi:ribosome-associated toxin RatA of RatAB toxin-antitoxin module